MNITQEKFKKANERMKHRLAAQKRSNTRVMTIMKICIGAFLAGTVLFFFSRVAGIIIWVLSAAVFSVVFYIAADLGKKLDTAILHCVSDRSINQIRVLAENELLSERYFEELNNALENEKDMRRRGYLRSRLVQANILAGDTDGAFRALYKDEELFAADSYFELLYYYGMVMYYTEINSTTGGTEYAEEAYRSFVRVFESSRAFEADVNAIAAAADCEQRILFHRGEWQKCLDYLTITEESGFYDGASFGQKLMRSVIALQKADCLERMGRFNEAKAELIRTGGITDISKHLRSKREAIERSMEG